MYWTITDSLFRKPLKENIGQPWRMCFFSYSLMKYGFYLFAKQVTAILYEVNFQKTNNKQKKKKKIKTKTQKK